MEKIIKELDRKILAGMKFSVPGATEQARRGNFYCSQQEVDFCRNYSLVNYGKDCHNNDVDTTTVWDVVSSL